MPWEHCGRSVLDDEPCPECGAMKTAWTVDFQVTREFKVRRPATGLRFELLAPGGEPIAGEPWRVEQAGGTVGEGELDELGAARVTPPGGDVCEVVFPGRQAGEVVPGADADGDAGAAPQPRGPGRARYARAQAARKHRFALVPEVRVVVPASAFAADAAFPCPGVLVHLRAAARALAERPGSRLLVVGVGGDPGRSRADALMALLRGEVGAFADQIGAGEAPAVWFQAMLHAIGCNPGAADDAPGDFTRESLRCFRREYAGGLFHPDGVERAVSTFGEGEEADLDADTRRAIVDAYVQAAPRPDPALLASGDPVEPGALGDTTVPEPAAALLVWQPERAEGDPAPVLLRAFEPALPWLFDLRWRRQEEDGVVQLSALTALPDGTSCRFEVERLGDDPPPATPPDSSRDEERVTLGTSITSLDGAIRGGVAWVKWTRDDEVEDPFHRLELFVGPARGDRAIKVDDDIPRATLELPDDTDDEERELFERYWGAAHATAGEDDAPAAAGEPDETDRGPLVFRVEAAEAWAYSHPPGVPLERLRFGDLDASGVALGHDGRYVRFAVSDGRVQGEAREAFVTAIVSLKVTEEAAS